jgi:DNA invertase Pin-like site-specific DNA recombinase
VLHRCDVRACCNPHHLFIGTQQDNIRDAAEKGRLSGSRRRPMGLRYRRPLSHLDEAVKSLKLAGTSVSEISRRLQIDRRTVRRALG